MRGLCFVWGQTHSGEFAATMAAFSPFWMPQREKHEESVTTESSACPNVIHWYGDHSPLAFVCFAPRKSLSEFRVSAASTASQTDEHRDSVSAAVSVASSLLSACDHAARLVVISRNPWPRVIVGSHSAGKSDETGLIPSVTTESVILSWRKKKRERKEKSLTKDVAHDAVVYKERDVTLLVYKSISCAATVFDSNELQKE